MKENLTQRRLDSTPKGLTVMADVYVSHAKNSEIWDIDGKKYIDFASGTATMIVGHSNEKILKVLHNQLDKFVHTFFQQIPYESYITLAEKLNSIVPGNFKKKTAFFVDGAGAVENAIKISKTYNKRSGVISFHGGYHGRTLLTASLAGKVSPYKDNMGTPVGEIYHVPFPSISDNVSLGTTIESLSNLFKYTVSPDKISCIIVEPVQGEGGFRIAPIGLMRHLREICDTHNIVLIADEVQCGFGRTGKMFAMEHYDVSADITVMSKAIGAGIPISAVTGKAEIMDSPEAGGLGGTYSGTVLGCVAGNAVLSVIEEDNLLQKSVDYGKQITTQLKQLSHTINQVVDVRGIGSMVAIEFDNVKTTKDIQKLARDYGLIVITCGLKSNVIRILYPLTIEQETFDRGVKILIQCIYEICQK
jgi:4-aminobutyrate aminotransferase